MLHVTDPAIMYNFHISCWPHFILHVYGLLTFPLIAQSLQV